MLSSGFPLLGLEGKRENQLPSLLSLSALCPSLRMERRRGQGKAGLSFPFCWYQKSFYWQETIFVYISDVRFRTLRTLGVLAGLLEDMSSFLEIALP